MPSRRDFLKVTSATIAGLVGTAPSSRSLAAPAGGYPVLPLGPVGAIAKGASRGFAYPDAESPAVLVRLAEPALGGVGPDRDIVAYSTLCTHKGCPVAYHADRKLMICPCHWSTFDPAKAGTLVIGQASQNLPQITLRVEGGIIQAVGVSGLIYGRQTNVARR